METVVRLAMATGWTIPHCEQMHPRDFATAVDQLEQQHERQRDAARRR